MNNSFANPPIEKVEEYTKALEGDFKDFDARIRKLVLVHDFTYDMKGFESKALFAAFFIFLIGIIFFMGWFYSVDLETRSNIAIWGAIGLTSVLGTMIGAVIGFVRSIKGLAAYLLRRDIHRLTKERGRQVKNIANLFKSSPITMDGIKLTKNEEISKILERISEDFREIDDLFDYYLRLPPISIISIASLLVSIIAIPSVYQLIGGSISDSQTIASYLPPLSIVVVFASIGCSLYYLGCYSRKENMYNLFGLQESEQKLVNSIARLNTILVGDDLTKLCSDNLLVFGNPKP